MSDEILEDMFGLTVLKRVTQYTDRFTDIIELMKLISSYKLFKPLINEKNIEFEQKYEMLLICATYETLRDRYPKVFKRAYKHWYKAEQAFQQKQITGKDNKKTLLLELVL